jgi:glutamate--cysteine ligase
MPNPYQTTEQRLSRLINAGQQNLLSGGSIGVEKESLRVAPSGSIAQTPHPVSLGSALMHPYITTDYSEALMEFVTPAFPDVTTVLGFLADIQAFVHQTLNEEEMLWATSMPCVVAGEKSIPIAQYGSSNIGQMKTAYRRGLGHRYGRTMQAIAGVHFNYSLQEAFWPVYQELEGNGDSLQDFISASYFGLIRNLQRFGWLVPYLFGASPAVCKSFLSGQTTTLQAFDDNTYYDPYATSLRMGDIGYQNNKEAEVGVKACYDSLEAYVGSLTDAIETPYPPYERFGVEVNGRYEQLNANILQIENEYYSTIRPKQPAGTFEKPTHALKRRGVKYVELRSIDVNAFEPLGISERQLRFLEAFLIFCLFHDSPTISKLEREEIDHNELGAAHRGRDPQLHLRRQGSRIRLNQWAGEILTAMEGICEVLDASTPDRLYTKTLKVQREKVLDPEATPSARMLATMRREGEGFYHMAQRMSAQHHQFFLQLPISKQRRKEFTELTASSLQAQRDLESSETESFAQCLANYFAQRL